MSRIIEAFSIASRLPHMNLPLHPISVHFPIALCVLIPFFAIVAMVGIYRFHWPKRIWTFVVLAHVLLWVSSLVAVNLGEKDEELVEAYVAEQQLSEHEEWGEKIPWLAGGALVLALIPLFVTKQQFAFHVLATLGGLALIGPVLLTGHSGGKLVYVEGAARAHVEKVPLTESGE